MAKWPESSRLSLRMQQIERAVGLLGVRWCCVCGEPHIMPMAPAAVADFVVLQRVAFTETVDGSVDEPYVVTEHVCLRQGNLLCLQRYYDQHHPDGSDLDPVLARWILDNRVWRQDSEWYGAYCSLIEDWMTDPVVELLVQRHRMGRRHLVIGETPEQFIRAMGWTMDATEAAEHIKAAAARIKALDAVDAESAAFEARARKALL